MQNSKVLSRVLSISVLAAVTGCAGRQAVLPENGHTMLEIYHEHMAGAEGGALLDARLTLRRPLTDDELDPKSYTRTAANEINALFVRLPNPDLIMYVFPHLSTEDQVPVPGYSTVFPMYERVIYALPGEAP